jgi:hypothetical protein
MEDKTEYQTAQETNDLNRLDGLCQDLKDRLEAHGFKVVKFQVRLSPDVLTRSRYMGAVIGVEIYAIWDNDLPPGTIKVSAMVQ